MFVHEQHSSVYFFSALHKNNDNLKGTGSGRGEDFTLPEQRALDCMIMRGSDAITGIDGGFESELGTTSSVSVIHLDTMCICNLQRN